MYIESFFSKMSIRFYKENDLSDFVWTCCEACEPFKKLFLTFFFRDFDFSGKIEIIREYAEGDVRPDFVMFTNGRLSHLIEVKILDQYDHFSDYIEAFPMIGNGYRGFIMNYPRTERCREFADRYSIHTWDEFLEYLGLEMRRRDLDQEIVKFYSLAYSYIKNVCKYWEVVHMEISNLESLEALNLTFRKVIKNAQDLLIKHNIEIEEYKFEAGFGYSGFYFKMITSKLPKPLYPWLGIYYNKQIVSIGFESIAGYCDQLVGRNITIPDVEPLISVEPIKDDPLWLTFTKSQEVFGKDNQYSADQQYNLLLDFLCRSLVLVDDNL